MLATQVEATVYQLHRFQLPAPPPPLLLPAPDGGGANGH